MSRQAKVSVLSLMILATFSAPAFSSYPWIIISADGSVNGNATTDYGGEGDILLVTSVIAAHNSLPHRSYTITVDSLFYDWGFEEMDTTTTTFECRPQEYHYFNHTHSITADDSTEHYAELYVSSEAGSVIDVSCVDFAQN